MVQPHSSPYVGTLVARPAAGLANRYYWTTDEHILYRDTGAAWVKVAVADYADLDGTPATFDPSVHEATHTKGGVDDIDSALDARAVALANQGDIPYHAAAANTLAALAPGAAGQALLSGGAGADPSFGAPTPGAHAGTHVPQTGGDPLVCAAPGTINENASAEGVADYMARSDHNHQHTAALHENGGGAEVNVGGLSGLLADDQHVIDAEAVSAAEAAGLALATGKNIKLIANLITNQTWSGLTAVLQAGEEITRTELCYVKNDGKMWLAQSNAAGTMPAIAMACPATIAVNAWGEFLLLGFYREDTLLTFALGDMLYVSDTVAGAFDNVLPADVGEQVQVLGKCLIATHIIYFNPSLELVEIS